MWSKIHKNATVTAGWVTRLCGKSGCSPSSSRSVSVWPCDYGQFLSSWKPNAHCLSCVKQESLSVVISSWPTSCNQSVAYLWKPALGISLQQCLSEALAKETVQTGAQRRESHSQQCGASWDIKDSSQIRILVDKCWQQNRDHGDGHSAVSHIPPYVEVDRYPAQVSATDPSPAPKKAIIGKEIPDLIQNCMDMKSSTPCCRRTGPFSKPEVACSCNHMHLHAGLKHLESTLWTKMRGRVLLLCCRRSNFKDKFWINSCFIVHYIFIMYLRLAIQCLRVSFLRSCRVKTSIGKVTVWAAAFQRLNPA